MTRSPVCDPNAEEQAIADLAMGDPEQEPEEMRCHPILAQVAREHALDMATRDYLDHVNPEGFGPNYRVEQAGYELPDWYDQEPEANNGVGYAFAAGSTYKHYWLFISAHPVGS